MIGSQREPMPALLSSRMVRRSPIFYGWIIIAAATVGVIMTSPGQTYGVSIFIEHFIADLGISRSLVSTLYAVGTLGGSFALPFIGRQIDRRGPRTMVLFIAVAFGLACIYMGWIASALMLAFGFIAIRMLGQGALSLVSQYTINQWWIRQRGQAMGLSGLVMSLVGIGLFPSLIQWLIDGYGWRVAYPVLGLLVIAVMVPVGFLFYRSQPERYGLAPDGDLPPTPGHAGVAAPAEENWTVGEAIRTTAFWILAASLASVSMLGTGLFFHAVSIFADNGLSAEVAATAFVPVALTTAVVTLVGGFLVDRVRLRYLLITTLVLQAVSLVLAHSMTGIALAFAYGMVLGATTGLMRSVSTVVWAAYFGRKHLGAITGVTTTIGVAASALGPLPFGVARDLLGSYDLVLNISAGLPLLLAIAAFFINRPQKGGER